MTSINKKISKAACLLMTALLICSSVLMFAGCETSHPKVTITVTFDRQEYEIDYKLYRNMYPQTVRHFIELANAGYYDGLAVHHYTSAFLCSGGYTYDGDSAANGGLIEKDYFAEAPKLNLTQSVYLLSDTDLTGGLNTVYGEFKSNGFEVQSNGLRHKYGVLVMDYFDIDSKEAPLVTTKLSGSKGTAEKSYSYNSATSLFYIFTGESNTTRNSTRAVFGELAGSDATDALDELLDAIEEYVSEHTKGDEDYSFTKEVNVVVGANDPIAEVAGAKIQATYQVPNEPIVIKSVKVNKL